MERRAHITNIDDLTPGYLPPRSTSEDGSQLQNRERCDRMLPLIPSQGHAAVFLDSRE
jgi:hypothetical protein